METRTPKQTKTTKKTGPSDQKLVYYGPHACQLCGRKICKVSNQQGGEEYDYPDGPIYPNTPWIRHLCGSVEAGDKPKVNFWQQLWKDVKALRRRK